MIVTDQPTSAKNKTSLAFTLASGTLTSPGNTQVLVKLMPTGHPNNTCTPSYLATGLSATAKAFTVALSDFKSSNDITESCTALTATGLDLVDIKNIEIIDRKQTTGTTTISVTLTNLNWVVAP